MSIPYQGGTLRAHHFPGALIVLVALRLRGARSKDVPTVLRLVNALIETNLPTTILWEANEYAGPASDVRFPVQGGPSLGRLKCVYTRAPFDRRNSVRSRVI